MISTSWSVMPIHFTSMLSCWWLFGSENSMVLMTLEKTRNLWQSLKRSRFKFETIWYGLPWSICEIWFGVCLKSKLRDNHQRLGSSLRTKFQVYLFYEEAGAKCWYRLYDLFSWWVLLPFFSMLILSLPPLAIDVKCTFFDSGFCVCRPTQFDNICWELIFFWILCLFPGDCLGRLNQWM